MAEVQVSEATQEEMDVINSMTDQERDSLPLYGAETTETETTEETTTETTVDENTEATESSSSETEQTEASPESETTAPSMDFTQFNSLFGKEVTDQDSLIAEITALKEKSEQDRKVVSDDAPEALKQFYQHLQSGKTERDFYRKLSTDYDKMSDSDVLFERWLENEDNRDIFNENAEVGKLMFSKELRNRQKNVEKASWSNEQWENYQTENDLTDSEISEEKDIAKIEKGRYDLETKKAREKYKQEQESLRTPMEQALEREKTGGATKEDINKSLVEYQNKIKESITGQQEFALDLGIEGVDPYKVGLDDTTKSELEKGLDNPFSLFKDFLGVTFTEENPLGMEIEHKKLVETIAKAKMFDQLGNRLTKYVIDKAKIKEIDETNENPPTRKTEETAPIGDREQLLAALRESM